MAPLEEEVDNIGNLSFEDLEDKGDIPVDVQSTHKSKVLVLSDYNTYSS